MLKPKTKREIRAEFLAKQKEERITAAKADYERALAHTIEAGRSAGLQTMMDAAAKCDDAYELLVRLMKKDGARQFAKEACCK